MLEQSYFHKANCFTLDICSIKDNIELLLGTLDVCHNIGLLLGTLDSTCHQERS